MRIKYKPTPKVGDKRTVSRFLLFPLEINNEIRWLEHATWEEERITIVRFFEVVAYPEDIWSETRWINP